MDPCDARASVVRAPHGNLQCFSYPTGPVRGPCGTRKGAIRHSYGHVRELTQPEFAKIPHGRRKWPYGARTRRLWSPHGLCTGCLRSLNPYGARKLKIHALKLYGPRTGGGGGGGGGGGRIRTAPPCDASVTSQSRAPYGLIPGCFEQRSYVQSGGPHGPRTHFAYTYGTRIVLMHALLTDSVRIYKL